MIWNDRNGFRKQQVRQISRMVLGFVFEKAKKQNDMKSEVWREDFERQKKKSSPVGHLREWPQVFSKLCLVDLIQQNLGSLFWTLKGHQSVHPCLNISLDLYWAGLDCLQNFSHTKQRRFVQVWISKLFLHVKLSLKSEEFWTKSSLQTVGNIRRSP